MKKITIAGRMLALLVAMLMCVSCFTAFASANTSAILTVSSVTAKSGDLVDIIVSINDNPGIAGMTAILNYDNTKLTPVSVTAGSAISNKDIVTNIDSVPNPATLTFLTANFGGATNTKKSGELFVFTFKVKSTTTCDTTVTVSCDDACNQLYEDVNIYSGMGKVTIKASDNKEDDTSATSEAEITLKKGASKIAYMAGYPDGSFLPNQAATRYEVVEAFYNLFDVDVKVGDLKLNDVDSAHNGMVKLFASAGVITGYTNNTFRGEKTITRGEFCTIICRLLNIETKTVRDAGFNDVSGHWAKNYINACANKGFVNGKGEGRFAPDANITRAEVVTLINRITGAKDGTACGYKDVPSNAWYFGAVAAAAK